MGTNSNEAPISLNSIPSHFLSPPPLSQFCHKCRYVAAAFHTADRSMARNRFSLHLDRPRAVITVIFLSHALKRGGLQIARPRPENGRMVDYVSNILDRAN